MAVLAACQGGLWGVSAPASDGEAGTCPRTEVPISHTLRRKAYAYGSDPDLTKPLPACERDARVVVEEAIREAARSFTPSEVHTTHFAVAGSVAVLDVLRSYRHHGWSYGNGMSDEEDYTAED